MKVLYITTKPPAQASGSEIRNYHVLRSFVVNTNVTAVNVIVFDVNRTKISYPFLNTPKVKYTNLLPKQRSIFSSTLSLLKNHVPYVDHLLNHNFDALISKQIIDADLVVFSELDGYLFASRSLKQVPLQKKIILDCHNVDYNRIVAEMQNIKLPFKIFSNAVKNRIKKLEIEAISNVSLIFACSQSDANYFRQYISEDKIVVIPNGVDTQIKSTKVSTKNKKVIFMGLLSYYPNIDAVRYYLDEIHPLVKLKVPAVQFEIIGRNAPSWLVKRAHADKNIKLSGYVQNVDQHLATASVCVCPIKSGSGTRLKLLHYMASNKPIVTTTMGCEGIDVVHNKHLLIADEPSQFASSVVKLLTDRSLAERIATSGRQLADDKYNWLNIEAEIIKAIKVLS